jgi:hypothetical protein
MCCVGPLGTTLLQGHDIVHCKTMLDDHDGEGCLPLLKGFHVSLVRLFVKMLYANNSQV